ncbi:MAG: HlyD family type I secretion periplasmic adaptor subunit [Arcobacteraceae bacterium]
MSFLKNTKSAFEYFKANDNPKTDYRRNKLTEQDYEFINSLSAAVLQIRPNRLHWVLVYVGISLFAFVVWASFAPIDEIARGTGVVVPSGQNQVIQNLEGGIVSEILVREGDFVEKDQVLIKISNEKSSSNYQSTYIKKLAYQAEIARLNAQLEQKPFEIIETTDEELLKFMENERNLYETNQQQLESKLQILKEQLNQKESDLKDAKQTADHLRVSLNLIKKEVEMTIPMLEKGLKPQVEFLQLQRQENDAKLKLQSANLAIPKLESEINEINKRIDETYQNYFIKTRERLNEITASSKELDATSMAYEDQVTRTNVKSPLNGVVQKLHINTIGGAIKPAQDLIEIVPTDSVLVVEVKIKPKDIAFIYTGQQAKVKFSAYDFSIYGSLDGKVINISPDTVTDKENQTYYIVRVETDQGYIGTMDKQLKIIPGMTTNVDILTGKKTVMDYILKPILKTKQYSFKER